MSQFLNQPIRYNSFGVQCFRAVSGYKFNGQIQQLEEGSRTVTEGGDDAGILLLRPKAGLPERTLESCKSLQILGS